MHHMAVRVSVSPVVYPTPWQSPSCALHVCRMHPPCAPFDAVLRSHSYSKSFTTKCSYEKDGAFRAVPAFLALRRATPALRGVQTAVVWRLPATRCPCGCGRRWAAEPEDGTVLLPHLMTALPSTKTYDNIYGWNQPQQANSRTARGSSAQQLCGNVPNRTVQVLGRAG